MAITNAVFIDAEASVGNTFATGTLDFTLTSPQTNFSPVPEGMKPNTTVTRDITVTNTGTLPLFYRGEYHYASGSSELCNALSLTITKDASILYTGLLTGFTDFTTPITLLPGASDSLVFSITLPLTTPPSMSGKTCSFALPFVGWQTNVTESAAGFIDYEVADGNNLGTADFEAPPAPTIYQYKDDVVINSATLKQCWEIVTDPQNLHNPITYEYESYNDDLYTSLRYANTYTESANKESCGSFGLSIVKHAEGAPEGHVYHRIRAVDSVGNKSNWTYGHFLIDNTSPITSISVSNSPARTITEEVKNSSFETIDESGKPSDWDAEGDVKVVTTELGVTPLDGSKMVKIGRETDPGQNTSLNFISQPILNSAKNISFWYNFLSYEDTGNDEPGFVVFINDKMVYQMWARDLPTGASPNISGWHQFLYDISSIPKNEQPVLTIVFHAGNSGGTDKQSWVYIDSVSVKDIVVKNTAVFTLPSSDQLTKATSWYQIGTDGIPTKGKSFQLSKRPTGDIISYWSVDEAGNEESPHKTLRVIYDNDKPDTIDDLSVVDWTNGEFSLNFSAVDPHDAVTESKTATGYDIRYSTSPITNDTEFNSSTPIDSTSPQPAGESERISIKGLEPNIQYWFAVKAKDAAPNMSLLGTGSTTTNGPTVIINEILVDPTGADSATKPNGEWIELYNNASYDIDVTRWALYDNDNSHELSISSSNTNTGSTVIPTKGFLVIYKNGDTDFSLNNTTDTVRLFNKTISSGGILVDTYTYTSVTTNKSFARIPDGTGAWIDPKATPGEKNSTEQGSYSLGQHEPDELGIENIPLPTPSSSIQNTPTGQILGVENSTPTPTKQELTSEISPTPSPTPEPIQDLTPTPIPELPGGIQ